MSEEEFSALRRICAATGARSVSDMAREAMRNLLNESNAHGVSVPSMGDYTAQMKNLEQKVEQLSTEIALFKAERKL